MCLYSLCDGTKYLIYTKKIVPSVKQHIRLRAVVYNLYNSIVPTSWRAALYNKHHIVYRCRNIIINSNKGGLSLSDESFPNGGARGAFAKPSRSVSSRRLRGASKAPPRTLRRGLRILREGCTYRRLHEDALEGSQGLLKGSVDELHVRIICISYWYNGGLLPDIILSTRCSYIGEPF